MCRRGGWVQPRRCGDRAFVRCCSGWHYGRTPRLRGCGTMLSCACPPGSAPRLWGCPLLGSISSPGGRSNPAGAGMVSVSLVSVSLVSRVRTLVQPRLCGDAGLPGCRVAVLWLPPYLEKRGQAPRLRGCLVESRAWGPVGDRVMEPGLTPRLRGWPPGGTGLGRPCGSNPAPAGVPTRPRACGGRWSVEPRACGKDGTRLTQSGK